MDLWRRLTNSNREAPRQADTSSRCVAESASVSHDFVLVNYSQIRDLPVNEAVTSGHFTVGGHDWFISFYPGGWSTTRYSQGEKEGPGYAAASVCLRRQATTVVIVKARITIGLVDRHGTMANTRTSDADHFYASEISPTFPGFVCRSKLTSRRYLVDDCLTIRCVLTVIKPRTEGTTAAPAAAAPLPDMLRHLQRMLEDGKGADVTINVGGRAFRAHRCVLAARSPVFDAELFGPMKRKDAERVEVHDMDPAVFELLLHFIYTDSLPGDGEGCGVAVTQHLLVAADRYAVDKLKEACDVKLRRSLDVRTVATTLALAEQHHCPLLRDACVTFMSSSRKVLADVLATNGFRHLTASIPLENLTESLP
ncbi:BTB/POZ and MATH domain-containing protein 2-like [Triticum aestivum]|uniref:BTB/POZ and MATH domain-containing protein 2-like n=1 Tax=Triticum aestivum TaxID=4565 RepID=UPI001D001D10|nr:BTB/POZ and MATH domain-containing protein 2-like [Triticum aestivum]